METFNYQKLEQKWQKRWAKDEIYFAQEDTNKPKKLVLIEFPYPSGEGLHMGHLRPFLAGDIYSRYLRMNGYNVMYPIGWDAFGLPAENFAIKNKVQPSVATAKNVANAKRQLQGWGTGFDWSREINTTDPMYYKWTQWIFLQFYKAGLAYEATGLINWCPKDKTGLANEEVIDGCCERCGTPVEKKELRQWYLKITAYAEKLLDGLKTLAWPEKIKIQQENWIGKSEGAEIDFPVVNPRVKRFVILHGRASTPKDHFYPWLKKELEKKGFQVEVPEMPGIGEPNDEEQTDFVQKNCHLDDTTVIVGHSMGGVVALRLLERGIKVHGVVLLATPVTGKFLDGQKRASVTKAVLRGFDYKRIKKQADYFRVITDSTDKVVPREDGQILAENLGSSRRLFSAENPHFTGKQEPVLLGEFLPNIKVFTTRPDTIFGATYVVLAPENPYVQSRAAISENKAEIEKYVVEAKKKTDIQRSALEKEKTGVELKGLKVLNPATKEAIPVWIADYVLSGYGTGAIMAVPAHDERDREFAQKFNLSIIDRPLIPIKEAIKKFGTAKIQYKLRDWVFSRQRYWGEPIPLIHCEKCGVVPVPDDELPLTLPDVKDYEPTGTGESPLAAISDWVNTKCPNCDGKAKRETNTMPQWAGSSWYWLRYSDPHNDQVFAAKKKLKYWQPVDVYFGGMEHTTLHLLYSRFWNQFLFDQGLVTESEPYARRIPHGLILGPDGEKMSKSRGNVVNPDEIVAKYGVDVLRMYEPFLGPHDANVPWSEKGIVGIKRFLDKVARFASNPELDSGSNIHKLIKKIGSDIEQFKFNTAIAAFMEFLNESKDLSKGDWEKFLIVLAPFAPHITEELWHKLGHKDSVHIQVWPKFDPKLVADKDVTIVVQILGRVRASLQVPAGSDQSKVKELALAEANVQKHLADKEIVKEIFVKDKLINFVVK